MPCPFFLPPPPSPKLTPTPLTHTQIRTRPPLPTHPPFPPKPLNPLHRLRPHPNGQHPGAEQHLGARHHRHVSGRLFRHPDGRARDAVSVQRHGRAHVLWEHDELFGYGVAVCKARGRAVDGGGVAGLLVGVGV